MVFDITNGKDKDEPHTFSNIVERQQKLLDILKRSSNWKSNHDGHLAKNNAAKYSFLQKKLGSASVLDFDSRLCY